MINANKKKQIHSRLIARATPDDYIQTIYVYMVNDLLNPVVIKSMDSFYNWVLTSDVDVDDIYEINFSVDMNRLTTKTEKEINNLMYNYLFEK